MTRCRIKPGCPEDRGHDAGILVAVLNPQGVLIGRMVGSRFVPTRRDEHSDLAAAIELLRPELEAAADEFAACWVDPEEAPDA